jgi:hypothetical protein
MESLLPRLTSPVEVRFKDGQTSLGSGFFFQVLEPADPKSKEPQWRSVQRLCVITNRHVIQPEKFSSFEKLVFNLRVRHGDGADWLPIEINQTALAERLHLHPNAAVDVAAVDVLDLVRNEIMKRTGNSPGTSRRQIDLEPWFAVSRENFPGVSRLKIGAGDDVITIGYPKGLYDEFNKLPILKRGMLITPWGLRYGNLDGFLIDARFFHGSSGSIVISRPTDLLMENGRLLSNTVKEFLFLGVYSGEPFSLGPQRDTDDAVIVEKRRADLGLVWYYYTVEQALQAPSLKETQAREAR